MKTLPHILLLFTSLFFISCGSPNYFLKEANKNDPHAKLSLRNGTTQVTKIDGKYAPEDATYEVRLKPGRHTIEVSHQAQQMGALNAIIGLPGRDVTTHTTMEVDLAPGKSYRADCNINGPRGAAFYLVDQSGLRTNFTRAYSRAY